MASTSPLHQLQHAAVSVARGVLIFSLGTADKVVRGAAGLVASRLPGGSSGPAPAAAPVGKPVVTPVVTPDVTPDVEEPVASVTSIDEAASAVRVEATPADVARTVAKKAPAKKAPAKKTPAAKAPAKKAAATKAPTTKSTPSGQLPPRRRPEPDAD